MEQTTKTFRKRNAILACLRSTDTHPSADWVYERVRGDIPDISLATVYRNLALFKREGVITSVGTVGGIERFDANTAPHVHFICACCARVQDLHQMAVPTALSNEAASQSGGAVDSCQLTFYGTCAECMKKS